MPVAPGRSCAAALRSLASLPETERPCEILTVSGTQPSQQRNLAAQHATGSLLYFLDNDSCVKPGTIARLKRALRLSGAGVAGGPNVSARPVAGLDAACENVLASPLGSPMVYRRYASGDVGPREASEKSLILCNLLVRRDLFLELRGFDPRLYPNEENEFLNRVRGSGVPTVYVGNATITKRRNYSVAGFVRENWRYGRGRMEQVAINPHAGDLAFIAIPATAVLFAIAAANDPGMLRALGIYGVVVAAESVRVAGWRAPAVAALMGLRHASYLVGLLSGVFSAFRRRGVRISPMRVNLRKSVVRGGRVKPAVELRFEIGFMSVKEAS
jgi:hypothetical protein